MSTSKLHHRQLRRATAPLALLGVCWMLTACGTAGRDHARAQGRAATQPTRGAGGVLAARYGRSPHASSSGSAARAASVATPRRPFSPAGVWNRPLAPDASLDPRSAEMVAQFNARVAAEQRERSGPWINTSSYGVPIVTVPGDQPTVSVELHHSAEPALSAAWSAVPLPPDAHPANGTDGSFVLWQPSTDRMWEFWQLSHASTGWQASWGGAMQRVSRNPGVYGAEAWPGGQPWWGATASSLALAGGVITIEDLRRGRINHALALALPEVRGGVFASPARRTDGTSADPLALPEGARLRLDPQLNIASLSLPPLVREMALAAQRYGILVRDFAGVVVFYAQDPTPTGSNPYAGPGGFFEGKYPTDLLASFPWSHLQLLKLDLHSS